MEKEWNGKRKEAQIAAIRKLQARRNMVIAVGNRIPLNNFDQSARACAVEAVCAGRKPFVR